MSTAVDLPVADRAATLLVIWPTRRRTLASVLLVEAAAIVAYWTAWVVDPSLVATSESPEYEAFEAAFPLPDAWVVLCLIATAVSVLRRSTYAIVWALLGTGAGVFLGLIDIAFDLQHGLLTAGAEGALEGAIVVVILATSYVLGRASLGWFRQLQAGVAGGGAR